MMTSQQVARFWKYWNIDVICGFLIIKLVSAKFWGSIMHQCDKTLGLKSCPMSDYVPFNLYKAKILKSVFYA